MSGANPDYYFRKVPSFKRVSNGNAFEEKRGFNQKKVVRQSFKNGNSMWNKENSNREPFKEYVRSSNNREVRRNQDSIQSRFEHTHYI
jgi:hypothetical protein